VQQQHIAKTRMMNACDEITARVETLPHLGTWAMLESVVVVALYKHNPNSTLTDSLEPVKNPIPHLMVKALPRINEVKDVAQQNKRVTVTQFIKKTTEQCSAVVIGRSHMNVGDNDKVVCLSQVQQASGHLLFSLL
jgi:hypothetical protein